MIKKYSYFLVLAVIVCIFQQAIFSRIQIYNFNFDTILVFVICFALLSNEVDCLVMAILLGIIKDCFFPYIFGLNTILYLTSSLIIIQISKRIYKRNIIIPFLITILLTVYKNLLYFAYFYISSMDFDFLNKVVITMIHETILNCILSLIIYKIVKKLVAKEIMQREWKF